MLATTAFDDISRNMGLGYVSLEASQPTVGTMSQRHSDYMHRGKHVHNSAISLMTLRAMDMNQVSCRQVASVHESLFCCQSPCQKCGPVQVTPCLGLGDVIPVMQEAKTCCNMRARCVQLLIQYSLQLEAPSSAARCSARARHRDVCSPVAEYAATKKTSKMKEEGAAASVSHWLGQHGT